MNFNLPMPQDIGNKYGRWALAGLYWLFAALLIVLDCIAGAFVAMWENAKFMFPRINEAFFVSLVQRSTTVVTHPMALPRKDNLKG